MRKPTTDPNVFLKRRERLKSNSTENSAFVLYAGEAPCRSNDTNYKFRVDNNFYYLTGYEEEGAKVIVRPGKSPETVLFVHPKNPDLETWEGFLFGTDLAKTTFMMDETYELSEYEDKAKELLKEVDSVYYSIGMDESRDRDFFSILKAAQRSKGRKGSALPQIMDPSEVLSPMRRIKDEEEVALMKKSAQVAARAHKDVMSRIVSAENERELEGVFLASIMKQGAYGVAYSSICASADNATTLHYVFNDCVIDKEKLFLIDAGAEYKYYASDITRTYPAHGKFTDIQKSIYNDILKIQKEMIEAVKPGATFKELNEKAGKLLTQVMIDRKLLKGSVDENMKSGAYKKYYPHGLGHYLGMDVHDVGAYVVGDSPVPFEPGVALTIEPGIYIPLDDQEAPEELRGIGIRIEDDILVTEEGHVNLTSDVPKEVDEIEAFMSESSHG